MNASPVLLNLAETVEVLIVETNLSTYAATNEPTKDLSAGATGGGTGHRSAKVWSEVAAGEAMVMRLEALACQCQRQAYPPGTLLALQESV